MFLFFFPNGSTPVLLGSADPLSRDNIFSISQSILYQEEHNTVYPKKYAHGFCFAVLCCGYTLTDFPISIRLTSLALWQSNDCPSARWIWINTSCEFIMNDCITTTKQSTTKLCAYFLGYTVYCTHDSAAHKGKWAATFNSFYFFFFYFGFGMMSRYFVFQNTLIWFNYDPVYWRKYVTWPQLNGGQLQLPQKLHSHQLLK